MPTCACLATRPTGSWASAAWRGWQNSSATKRWLRGASCESKRESRACVSRCGTNQRAPSSPSNATHSRRFPSPPSAVGFRWRPGFPLRQWPGAWPRCWPRPTGKPRCRCLRLIAPTSDGSPTPSGAAMSGRRPTTRSPAAWLPTITRTYPAMPSRRQSHVLP
jgi:hypothetical protein